MTARRRPPPRSPTPCIIEPARALELGRWLTAAAAAEHEVERHLCTWMLAVGTPLLDDFVGSVGPQACKAHARFFAVAA